MKIKGWDKINGFTYKGYCIVNPIHNAPETRYMADVLDLNLAHKPKWELNVLTPKHKFIAGEEFIISLWDDNRLNTRKAVSKEMISDVSKFRMLVEEMIDELLKHRLISATTANSHSYQSVGASTNYHKQINPNYYGTINAVTTQNGILNTITANSNTIQWAPSTSNNLPNEMLKAIKELQEQIDKLKQQQNEI